MANSYTQALSETATQPAKPAKRPRLDTYAEALAHASQNNGMVVKRAGTSPSMLGEMQGKYIVVVPQAEYQPGDDVTFKDISGNNITHRVTHVKPGFVFTKGTFNKNGDGWIPIKQVYGKVVRPGPKM